MWTARPPAPASEAPVPGPVPGVVLVGVLVAVLLAGCATVEDAALDRAGLERAVAELYPPEDRGTAVEVACGGGLGPAVGASQECRVDVGRQRAQVRATVTSAGEDGPRFEAVPVVPSERVARTVLDGLVRDGYAVTSVVCDHELLGVAGTSVPCSAVPADGGAGVPVTATVRRVAGLDVVVRYRLGG